MSYRLNFIYIRNCNYKFLKVGDRGSDEICGV